MVLPVPNYVRPALRLRKPNGWASMSTSTFFRRSSFIQIIKKPSQKLRRFFYLFTATTSAFLRLIRIFFLSGRFLGFFCHYKLLFLFVFIVTFLFKSELTKNKISNSKISPLQTYCLLNRLIP